MIVLDTTSKVIQVVLAGAITTNQLRVTSHYDDNTTTAFTPGSNRVATNNTTAVTAVAAPAASTQRNVHQLEVYNADTVSATVTVQAYDGTNTDPIVRVALATTETLHYGAGQWCVTDASGQIKNGTVVPDGDKGDITVSASGATWTIDNDAVTNAKRANMADSTISGRAVGAGTGDPTDLTATQVQAVIDTTTSALSPFARYTGNQVVHAVSATNQSLTTAVDTYLNLPDTDNIDTDTMHYTSGAALTGTVTKTAASTTIAGASTAFTTELSVGQMISIPGGAVEYFVVTAIASDTSLTVSVAAANTAAGQTATRMNSPVVIRTAGTYLVLGKCRFASSAVGIRQLVILNKRATGLANEKRPPVTGDTTDMSTWGLLALSQWDWVELRGTQTSGGALNVNTADLALIRVDA